MYVLLIVLHIEYIGQLIPYLILLYCMYIIIANLNSILQRKTTLCWVSLLYILYEIMYIIFSPPLDNPSYGNYGKLYYLLFSITGVSFYILGRKNIRINTTISKNITTSLIIVFVVRSLVDGFVFWSVFRNFKLFDEDDLSFYYQILPYCLSWMLIPMYSNVSNKYLIIVLLLFTITTIIFASKRGPLISIILSFLAFYFLKLRENKKNIITHLIVLSVITFVLFAFFSESTDQMLSRFDMNDDVSSGRYVIWETILTKWWDNGLVSVLFGNGFESTHMLLYREIGRGIGAHNDFLELLYCNGIVGFALFLSIWLISAKILFKGIYHLDVMESLVFISAFCMFLVGAIYSSNFVRFVSIFFGIYFYYYAGLSEYRQNVINKSTNLTTK